MADFDAIFKAYDIRGTVGDQINAKACHAIGHGFARHISASGATRIVMGRDMRPDGIELSRAFADGVAASGIEIVDLGLCATEMVYFASGLLDVPGAMFTASHNPIGYNGIKLCGAGASPIGADTGLQEIKANACEAMAHTPTPLAGRAAGPAKISEFDVLDRYLKHVLSFVDIATLRPLRVVVDAGNGMAGLVVPAMFETLPFQLDMLYGELDGTFPNHPADPLQPENLKDLQHRVRSTGADIGFAFDGDADRVFAVDETTRPLSGSTTTALVAQQMLERQPGAVIVHNLICSAAVPEVITELGGKPERCRVGHSFMKQMMASTGAVFGGEHSGHYYFRDNFGADSAMIATVLILEALSQHGRNLSSLTAPLQRYCASGEINTRVDDVAAVLERVANAFTGCFQDRLDGLTIKHDDWWFNLRPSNTEPLLRLNLEAATRDEVNIRVAQVKALFS